MTIKKCTGETYMVTDSGKHMNNCGSFRVNSSENSLDAPGAFGICCLRPRLRGSPDAGIVPRKGTTTLSPSAGADPGGRALSPPSIDNLLGVVTFQRLKISFLLNDTYTLRRSWGLAIGLVPAAVASPVCDNPSDGTWGGTEEIS